MNLANMDKKKAVNMRKKDTTVVLEKYTGFKSRDQSLTHVLPLFSSFSEFLIFTFILTRTQKSSIISLI